MQLLFEGGVTSARYFCVVGVQSFRWRGYYLRALIIQGSIYSKKYSIETAKSLCSKLCYAFGIYLQQHFNAYGDPHNILLSVLTISMRTLEEMLTVNGCCKPKASKAVQSWKMLALTVGGWALQDR